jgi:glycosyltransferase involved in cell wall biosynthesis
VSPRPRLLVVVTQLLDPADPALGFTTGLLEALSERVERLVVIGNEVRSIAPSLAEVEVVSLGKEDGAGRGARALAYERALTRLVARRRAGAILGHMCPGYVIAAAPLARLFGCRVLLWFAHPQDSRKLRLAERAANTVLTSLSGAYPHPGPKVCAIGQAIDVDRFTGLSEPELHEDLRLLALGRTSDSKDYETMITGVVAARAAGVDVSLRIVGSSVTAREGGIRRDLLGRLEREGLSGAVRLDEGVGPGQIPGLIGACDGLLNTTIAGSGDKVVFEAMASGRPVIASNPAMSELLGGTKLRLALPPKDPEALAEAIAELASAARDLRAEVGRELRARVVAGHSLAHWADEVAHAAGMAGSVRVEG